MLSTSTSCLYPMEHDKSHQGTMRAKVKATNVPSSQARRVVQPHESSHRCSVLQDRCAPGGCWLVLDLDLPF
ncbi:hypothetical protein CY34DRAFT_157927 [Suillus luteus UH-Slu-Lm8-n1]|uniref:Uncharacterized protein n=1 Tax=Suillus luteus UH-Slu-Lm8-n1 TaxID=930992 RepID=A0A0C9ZWL2_9AGAM|nr:hypothetical protein CY34DRAFT_157927 [Suillus luteus UH-Slu-Lm8-n1]